MQDVLNNSYRSNVRYLDCIFQSFHLLQIFLSHSSVSESIATSQDAEVTDE